MKVLGARLNFSMMGQATEAKYFGDFIERYISSDAGHFMLLGYFLAIISSLYLVYSNYKCTKKTFIVSSFIMVILTCIGCYPRDILDSRPKYYNVFQINGIALQKFGDFDKHYSEDYIYRKNLNIEMFTGTGLNQRKNVIVLIVESLGCNYTYICGKGPSYMPNIEQIMANNQFFNNYYSIFPSTSLATLAIIKSVPVIQNAWIQSYKETKEGKVFTNSLKSKNEYSNSLIKMNDLVQAFRSNGYKTRYISSSDLVFFMDIVLNETYFDEVIESRNKAFVDIKTRYMFNSISDEQMFDFIISKIGKEKDKFFYMTKTASNHSPYTSPLGKHNLKKAFEYTDKSVADFINKLEKIGYFNDGIVVMLGDHHAWDESGKFVPREYLLKYGDTYVNKVPLAIIDGKNKSSVNNVEFSHASLGVMLQYLELPQYKYNQFNVNPLVDEDKSEIIFGYDYDKVSFLSVKHGEKKGDILLNGDDTEFLRGDFSKEEQEKILGFISYFRR
ncbi:MAG: LTA synthase family protein [Succinivibrionaceae bacterium]